MNFKKGGHGPGSLKGENPVPFPRTAFIRLHNKTCGFFYTRQLCKFMVWQNPPALKTQTMSTHIETGKTGEDLAALYLENRGYHILERNWRSRRNEVDIIANKKEVLHFVEVKTRTSLDFALPESKVKRPKLQHLKEAAEVYLYLHPAWKWIQFDILSIIKRDNGTTSYFLIEDVF